MHWKCHIFCKSVQRDRGRELAGLSLCNASESNSESDGFPSLCTIHQSISNFYCSEKADISKRTSLMDHRYAIRSIQIPSASFVVFLVNVKKLERQWRSCCCWRDDSHVFSISRDGLWGFLSGRVLFESLIFISGFCKNWTKCHKLQSLSVISRLVCYHPSSRLYSCSGSWCCWSLS